MRNAIFPFVAVALIANACGGSDDSATSGTDGGQLQDGATISDGGGAGDSGVNDAASNDAATIQRGCALPTPACYTVFAQSNDTLYYLDQTTQTLMVVGSFQAPTPDGGSGPDPIVDLAVTPDDVIWVVSATALYTADPTTGRVTFVGHITTCGTQNVALAADRAGHLYLSDFDGAICPLDTTTMPPTVGSPITMSGNLALSGDLAVVGDGTVYGTTYDLGMASTQNNNTLATIDLTNGNTTAKANATGFPQLFGVAYGGGKVLAFTHDGSGQAITIDPTTGVGLHYGTFDKPDSSVPISFAGAGVNPLVTP